MLERRKIIGFVTLGGENPDSQLLEWLAYRFPVTFENRNPGDLHGLDGVVFLAGSPEHATLHQKVQVPSLVILNLQHSKPAIQELSFTNSKLTPWIFRSRNVPQELACVSPLSLEDGDEAIALLDGRPVWAVRVAGSSRHDMSAVSLPRIDPKEGAKESFHGRNFLGLLPIYDFLQRVSGENEWSAPAVRACFMFDDPNLHGSRYGWLDYPEIAQHAREHNYHATFATVPLDGWYASRRATSLFSGAEARLSLLIHGNNHVLEELSCFPNEAEAVAHLAQAIRRIERLEQRTGVQVCRVMAPPHGTCTELALQVMAQLGFEALCTALFVLPLRNAGRPWTQTLGLNIAEIVAGTPVIARFRLDYLPRNSALLAAYLGQPIILYGHHQDVADGLSVLGDIADYVNSLGNVRWTNVRSISRTNYLTRRRNGRLEVRAYSRRLEVVIPSDIETLSVQRPWLDDQHPEALRIRTGGDVKSFQNYSGEALRVVPGDRLEIYSAHPLPIDPNSVGMPKLRVRPFFLRQLCCLRDRLQPSARFLHSRNNKLTKGTMQNAENRKST